MLVYGACMIVCIVSVEKDSNIHSISMYGLLLWCMCARLCCACVRALVRACVSACL